jgi:hypothetical protein
VRESMKENHYYSPRRYDLFTAALDFLFSNISLREFEDIILNAPRATLGSSFPQEFDAVKGQERYLSVLSKERIDAFSTRARQIFLSYEQSSDSYSRNLRCAQCQYLLPFIISKEFKNWDVNIENVDFEVAYIEKKKGELRSVHEVGTPGLDPNSVWIAAATTPKDQIKRASDQKALLLETVREMVPASLLMEQCGLDGTKSEPVVYMKPEDFTFHYNQILKLKILESGDHWAFPLLFDERIRKTLDGCFLIWELHGKRFLYMTKEALNQSQSVREIVVGLYRLMDTICTPIIYNAKVVQKCQGNKTCPVFKAIIDKRKISVFTDNPVFHIPRYISDYLETMKNDLPSQFSWLFKRLNSLGSKIAQREKRVGSQ